MPTRSSSRWCALPGWSTRRWRFAPPATQVDDVLSEIGIRVAKDERVLITTLTKRMAEDLTDYLSDHDIRVRYLHSDIDTVERSEIIRDLRLGVFDVLVGINLLREGLDMPEVSLVAILDADKEGFLRAERSLIQTIGRAARNLEGRAILYADTMTGSMQRAIEETRPPPRGAGRLQRRARHRAARHRQGGRRRDGGGWRLEEGRAWPRSRPPHREGGGAGTGGADARRRHQADEDAREADVRERAEPRVRACRAAARRARAGSGRALFGGASDGAVRVAVKGGEEAGGAGGGRGVGARAAPP